MIHRSLQHRRDSDYIRLRDGYHFVPLESISPLLVSAVDCSENIKLYAYCRGFLFKGLREAYLSNQNGGALRGGSCISQQTAKNCFLPHKHSMLRKAVEAYYTSLIELVWGKKRIMECYLNIIEFGDGIYGCEAASQYYFHHSAAKLSKREAALLAACLPTPLKSNPAHPSRYLSRQASVVQGRMSAYGRVKLDARREDLTPRYVKMMEEENLWDFAWWVLTDGESLHKKKK